MERLFVQQDDLTEVEILPELSPTGEVDESGDPVLAPSNPEWVSLRATVDDGTAIYRVHGDLWLFLNAAGASAKRARWAASDAAAAAKETKTVMVTVDDGVMPATTREVELQDIATEAAKASVKARVANQEGVLPAQVLVETLDEHQARIASA